MKKRSQDVVLKYFTQKPLSALDIVLLSLSAVFLVLRFIRGFGYIAFPLLFCSLLALFFSRAARISIRDVRDVRDRLLSIAEVDITRREVISLYDLKARYLKVGRDGRLRSDIFCTLTVEFEHKFAVVSVCRIDLINEKVDKREITVKDGAGIRLYSETVKTPNGEKQYTYMKGGVLGDEPILLRSNDIEMPMLVERLSAYKTASV